MAELVGTYGLVGCTYPGRGITKPQSCDSAFEKWDASRTFYQFDAGGRATLVAVSGAFIDLTGGAPVSTGGAWTESSAYVTVAWDDPAKPPTTLERVGADTLHDGQKTTTSDAVSFWFVRRR